MSCHFVFVAQMDAPPLRLYSSIGMFFYIGNGWREDRGPSGFKLPKGGLAARDIQRLARKLEGRSNIGPIGPFS